MLGPWSVDSQRLILNRGNNKGLAELTLASGQVRPIGDAKVYASDWSADGAFLAAFDRIQNLEVMIPLQDPRPQTLRARQQGQMYFQLAPDGKRAAYVTSESGTAQAWVASYPSFADKRQVGDGARMVFWRGDGKELLVVTRD